MYVEEGNRAWEYFLDVTSEREPWSRQYASYQLAMRAPALRRRARRGPGRGEALERGVYDDPENPDRYQGFAEDPAGLTVAILERMDDFDEVRTVYHSDTSMAWD
jgi:hypothetical protein